MVRFRLYRDNKPPNPKATKGEVESQVAPLSKQYQACLVMVCVRRVWEEAHEYGIQH